MPVGQGARKTFASSATVGSFLVKPLFRATTSGFPTSPFGSSRGISTAFLAEASGEGCIKSGRTRSVDQLTPGVLSRSFERSLARGDFLRKPSGTFVPSGPRPLCYNIEKNTQRFWSLRQHRIAPICLKLRPIRDANLAARSIWSPAQLRTFVRLRPFWVTLYG